MGLADPGRLGYPIEARSPAPLTAALWGGPVRIFLSTTSPGRSTRSATSSAPRRFDVEDHSTNVFWLSLLSFGESWHHNHHAFPRSAVHGLRWWEVDPTAWLIRGMRRPAWRGTSSRSRRERQQQKLAVTGNGHKPQIRAITRRC